jgi:L-gulonate 3-dehydrogenase
LKNAGSSTPSAERIAIVGTGLVGASWTVVFARAGLAVTGFDAMPAQRTQALAYIDAALQSLAQAGLLADPPAVVRARVSMVDTLADALAGASYVQESIAESLPAKQALFATMDQEADADAILASSTSSFPTSSIAGALAGRSRCVVAHPVNPPHLIPFVEVSGATFTSADVIERTLRLQREVGQSPIHVRREIEGFVLNRLQWSLLAEACRLVADGIAGVDEIDAALRDGLGRRWAFMGPFEVGDLNAPNGLADYLSRFAPTIQAIATSRGAAPVPLEAEFVAAADAECRKRWSASERDARLAGRDARLLEMAALLSGRVSADPPADAAPRSGGAGGPQSIPR